MDSGTSRKSRIIVLSCLENEISDTTIKFASNAKEEVYIVARIPLFKSYVRTLLSTSAQATVVLVYEKMDILLELLLTMREVSADKSAGSAKHPTETSSTTVKLPLAFNVLLLRSHTKDNPGTLVESEMALQQILRFVSMNHGATYAAISEQDARNPDDYGLLVNRLMELRESSQMYAYDLAGMDFYPGATLHQLVPPHWDSWKKIALLSKSVPRNRADNMLASEEDFGSLDRAYGAYFSAAEDRGNELWALLGRYGLVSARNAVPDTHDPLLTYSDLIARLETEEA